MNTSAKNTLKSIMFRYWEGYKDESNSIIYNQSKFIVIVQRSTSSPIQIFSKVFVIFV